MPSLTWDGDEEEKAICYTTGRPREILYLEKDSEGESSADAPRNSEFRVMPVPSMKARDVIYICGRSGCGKSYWAKEYAQMYKRLFPARPVYLFSQLQEDETLDAIRPKRIKLETLMEAPILLEELKNSLCIFDDYDALQPKMRAEVMRVINEIATTGRHTTTSLIVISHRMSNYQETRVLLTEAQKFVVFPTGCPAKPMQDMLERYAGVDPKVLAALRRWKSRWLCFSVQFPAWVAGEKCVSLLP